MFIHPNTTLRAKIPCPRHVPTSRLGTFVVEFGQVEGRILRSGNRMRHIDLYNSSFIIQEYGEEKSSQ